MVWCCIDTMAVDIREGLHEKCKRCGQRKDDADEIAPVARSPYSVGPSWVCGECLDCRGE